ncbi:MAG: hypothetical protein ACLQCU_02750 [Acidimicrobiales bacterium]
MKRPGANHLLLAVGNTGPGTGQELQLHLAGACATSCQRRVREPAR